jgi:hypothetical protein
MRRAFAQPTYQPKTFPITRPSVLPTHSTCHVVRAFVVLVTPTSGITQYLYLKGMCPSSLYRPFGASSLPKLTSASILVFVGGLANDHLFFRTVSQAGKITILSSWSTVVLLNQEHKQLAVAIGIPAIYMLRNRLMAYGGANLFFSVCLSVEMAVKTYSHYLKRNKMPSDWHYDLFVILHQLGSWYFIPRANRIWNFIVRNLNRQPWLWLPTVSLVAWSFSTVSSAMTRALYPSVFSLINKLNSWYIHSTHSIKRTIRSHFHRCIFSMVNAISGASPMLLQYLPLHQADCPADSEIRLLKLHSASPGQIIRASLVHNSLSLAPAFEAMSYRWSSGDEIPILINDQKFLVSGLVHQMLTSMRTRTGDRLVWIDSICINQTDHDEKSWQIGLMKQIYSSASRVVAWLDSPAPGALSALSEVGDAWTKFRELEGNSLQDRDPIVTPFIYGNMSTPFRLTGILLCNSFFFRTWIIQEVALAQKLVFKLGKEEISREEFLNASKSFSKGLALTATMTLIPQTSYYRLAEGCGNIEVMNDFRSRAKKDGDGLPLGQLLLAAVDFECSDQRDRVFGLLGLSTKDARDAINCCYHADVTADTVFISAARFTLLSEKSFCLLELAGSGYEPPNPIKSVRMPSWVPRWKAAHVTNTAILISQYHKLNKTATFASCQAISQESLLEEIKLQGLYVDKIVGLSSIWDDFTRPAQKTFREQLSQMTVFLDVLDESYNLVCGASHKSHEMLNHLLWRVVCHQDRLSNQDINFTDEGNTIQEDARQLRALIGLGDGQTSMVERLRLDRATASLSHRLFSVLGRRLCITSEGYLGIVPPFANLGDTIWAFAGAPNPYVLRASSIDRKPMTRHELVGVCYIEGIMNGELENLYLTPEIITLV